MTLACITNYMPGRSCTYRDAHTADCDGTRHGKPCTGCAPREARQGLLCTGCWYSLEEAVTEWSIIRGMFGWIDSAVSSDGGSSSAHGPRLPYTSLQLDIDAAVWPWRSHVAPLSMWVATEAGAMDAVRFTRAVRTITRNHEWKEAARRLNRVRCPRCAQLTLDWTPPTFETGDVTVVCATEGCGEVLRQAAFETLTAIESTCCRKCRGDSCGDRGCACHDEVNLRGLIMDRGAPAEQRGEFAEPFDATRPEHRALLGDTA
jgi:hypothetical protein